MITWQTDPLLVDPESVPWNQWRTANHLLADTPSCWTPHLFLCDNILNFYGIMVRKSDFVKLTPRDRLLTRFPYLCMSSALQGVMKKNIHRLGMMVSYYFRGAERFSPVEGRKKVERYLKQRRIPLPFFRILASFQDDEIEFLREHFAGAALESFRHEPFCFPREVTPRLAYFIGACAGDGTLTPHQVRICDGHKDYMSRLKNLTIKLTGTNPGFRRETGAEAWLVILKSKWFARLIHFLSEQPFGRKYESLRMPRIFRVLPNRRELENRYCQGLFDTDGSCHKKSFSVSFGTKSIRLMEDLEQIFKERGIYYRLSPQEPNFRRLAISRSGVATFAENIGFLGPSKQNILCEGLESGPRQAEFCGVNLESIIVSSNRLNFLRLPKLLVVDSYRYLRNLLDTANRPVGALVGDGNLRQRRRWRQSGRIPFQALAEVADYQGLDIYEELEEQQARYAYPYAKYTMHLPSRVTDAVNRTLSYLTPSKRGLIVTTGAFRSIAKRTQEDVVTMARDLFDLPPTAFQLYDGRSFMVINELLRDYVQAFFRYEKPWESPSQEELTKLVSYWDEIM